VDLVRALLAVANIVLWSMAPCFLTKAIHHSIKVVVWEIKQVVYVFKNLNVSVEVDHLTVLHKLQFESELATRLVYLNQKIRVKTCKHGLAYLPNTKLGVVDDIVGHGELGLVLRWVHRLNLLHNAPLRHQNLTVVLRHVGQDCHH